MAVDGGSGRSAHERLRRLLLMVPWVMGRGSATVDEVCEQFDIDRETLSKDLDLLFVCGVPPYLPGDLMYAQIDGEDVVIAEAEYFDRPLRLTPAEALTLVATARAALEIVGEEPAGPLRRALGKLEGLLGGEGFVDIGVSASDEVESLRRAIAAAVEERRAIRIRYLGVASGSESERVVEPLKLVAYGGFWYLIGWCRLADDERHFRIDRIAELETTGEIFDPTHREDIDLDLGPGDGGFLVGLDLSPRTARWFPDYYPCEKLERAPDGSARVSIRASGEKWAVDLLLGLGNEARLLEPEWLREPVRQAAEKIYDVYADK